MDNTIQYVATPESFNVYGDILDSNIYVKNDSNLQFKSPRQYIEPFLQAVNASDSSIHIETSRKVSNQDIATKEEYIAYGRVLVEVNKGNGIPEHDSIIGMVYALDIGSPTIKVYTGQNARACTNLMVVGAEDVYSQSMIQNYSRVYKIAKEFYDNKAEEIDEYNQFYELLNNTYYSHDDMNKIIGKMLRGSLNTIGSSVIVQGVRNLSNEKSKYYVSDGTSANNLYQSMTQVITDQKSYILEKPNKTLKLTELFKFADEKFQIN